MNEKDFYEQVSYKKGYNNGIADIIKFQIGFTFVVLVVCGLFISLM